MRERAEEVLGGPHPVPDHDPTFPRPLDSEELDNGSEALFDAPQDLLVDLKRVLRSLFEEELVGDGTNVGLRLGASATVALRCGAAHGGIREDALRDKVAADGLGGGNGRHACRAVCFEAERLLRGGNVQEHVVNSGLWRNQSGTG